MKSKKRETIPVTCAIIQHKGKVLAALRGRQMSQSWKWEFPGGKIDEGETSEECIKREIREELNIEISVLQQLTPVVHSDPDKTIQLVPFICEIEKGEVKACEHEKVSWFLPEQLPSLNWAAADTSVLEEFLNMHTIRSAQQAVQ